MIRAGPGILAPGVMDVREPLYGNGIQGVLDEALAENAVAKLRFEGLSPADRAAFPPAAQQWLPLPMFFSSRDTM